MLKTKLDRSTQQSIKVEIMFIQCNFNNFNVVSTSYAHKEMVNENMCSRIMPTSISFCGTNEKKIKFICDIVTIDQKWDVVCSHFYNDIVKVKIMPR